MTEAVMRAEVTVAGMMAMAVVVTAVPREAAVGVVAAAASWAAGRAVWAAGTQAALTAAVRAAKAVARADG